MGLLDALFRSSGILGIAEETLDFALESAGESHPDEYMGLLRASEASRLGLDREGLVVTDVLVIPGTETNSVSATVRTSQVPNDVNAVGSVHSHPNGVLEPSVEDLASFGRGSVHLILGAPYRNHDWQAFDSAGEPRDLEVIDVSLPDPEDFFDFDQADIDEELREW
ncbi:MULTISPECIES: Mov34/MPN/PAD-1 family protein [Saliphagus]|uniref:Mov34/MPN/PAD-1 family protein n=1 Tax=Saliphagus infecundisoli TaxID=1849069 RepID=A0ABD5Q9J7_9EURY|nr:MULTISPECIES: Mov34/MPN/PAD-1 family protein [Saliphagus]